MSEPTNAAALVVLMMAAGLGVTLGPAWRAWRRFRDPRVVTCPETGRAAEVAVDAGFAAAIAASGDVSELRLATCSRWPAHHRCGQECLAQIEASSAPRVPTTPPDNGGLHA